MAMIQCFGVCTHGVGITWLGNTVVFSEDCPACIAQLRREGFEVLLDRASVAA